MTEEWCYEDEWFEETNVARKIQDFLVKSGYEITKFSENKKERGHDIEAEKDGQKVIMEVKGYPSDKYVRGPDKGKKKRTDPKLQANHWFGEAILSLLIAKSKNHECKIAIGLPRFKVYERLLEHISFVMEKLGIGYILVDEDENVKAEGL
jgi:hypothetical protein